VALLAFVGSLHLVFVSSSLLSEEVLLLLVDVVSSSLSIAVDSHV